jgi:hypothetical protein
MFTLALTVIPAKAGIQRPVRLGSRLRGNDNVVASFQIYQSSYVRGNDNMKSAL